MAEILGNVVKILEKLSGAVPGLSLLVGLAFLFLGIYDVDSFKSVTMRPQVGVVSLVIGGALVLISLGLFLLKPREPPDELITDSMVFLLLHYAKSGVGSFEQPSYYAPVLYAYRPLKPDKPYPADTADQDGWIKASAYAAQYLSHIGFLDSKHSEYALNKRGKDLLDSADFRAKNTQVFSRDLVPLTPSGRVGPAASSL
jgi:hypothetical protein